MLSVEQVSKCYGSKQVLDALCISFETGITAILAPSGSGKTTLLRLIAGLEAADSGTILLDGRADYCCAMVFQEDRLLDNLTVWENLALILQKPDSQIAFYLERLGLADFAGRYPQELSGGMQRRVALARALCADAPVLLLDEPFKGLDDSLREKAMDLVVQEGQNRMTLLVTHDDREARYCAGKHLLYGAGPPLNFLKQEEPR